MATSKLTDLKKTMTNKKIKPKSKSTKDKARNIQLIMSVDHTISNPSITVVKTAGEGLYIKLTQHQRNIAQQIKFITSALENGSVQYRSRHNKTDLTKVITALLVQLDCAVTTTYQCFTKTTFDGNSSFKARLEKNEMLMYDSTAQLVRWIDFESKDNGLENPLDKEKIMSTIGNFEIALAEVVRVVYECQLANSTGTESSFSSLTLPAKNRRSSSAETNATIYNRLGVPDELPSPYLQSLREEGGKDRKSSWSPGMPSFTQPPLQRASSLATTSEGSSTSDEERRRSGSTERYPSPSEHALRSTGSMSPDWDGRLRCQTVPRDLLSSPHPAIPMSVPVITSLPPLPGEETDGIPPPPLPKRAESYEEPSLELLSRTKGFTLPRMSQPNLVVNGRFSPDAVLTSSVENLTDAPPPVPLKKRTNHQPQPLGVNDLRNHHPPPLDSPDNDDVPPPLPVKQRRATTAGHDLPLHTPTHTPSHLLYRSPTTPDTMPHHLDLTLEGGVKNRKMVPPVPMRIESIPWVKSVLVQESPPPKPPRTDRQDDSPSPHNTPQHLAQPRPSVNTPASKQEEVFNAVRKYNEDVIKARTSGPDQAPPVPLKKKTVIQYKNLIQGYTYDESLMQPLYIPGMDAPPPLPPKRRRRRQGGGHAPSDRSATAGEEKEGRAKDMKTNSRDSLGASTDELLDDLEEGVDVNYLECEDASGYLDFNREEDGGYTLMGGPIDALIAYAASSTRAVLHYSEAFLLTYSTFITPGELIKKLLYRLEFFYKSKTRAVWESTTSLLVRVLTGLKQPLSQESQIQLIDVVHRMISNGNLKFAQLLRNALVEKLNQMFPDNKSSIPLGIALSARTQYTRKLSILDFSSDDLARQMTILDNELFQKVDVCEMLYFAKDQNEEKSPMLTQFTMHFNNVSQWTKVTLLKKGIDMKARCKLMMQFIMIMKYLLENYNNFNSYLAILSAIESAPMTRLDWTDKILKALEEPRQLIDNRGSFKNYREAFSQAKPPCIPYIGLYLQDLTFIEMQPSKLQESDGINFTKRWKQFKSVDHIRFAQTKQYTFDPDPEILSLFNNFEVVLTDEDLWAISNEIKPSARALRNMAAANST